LPLKFITFSIYLIYKIIITAVYVSISNLTSQFKSWTTSHDRSFAVQAVNWLFPLSIINRDAKRLQKFLRTHLIQMHTNVLIQVQILYSR